MDGESWKEDAVSQLDSSSCTSFEGYNELENSRSYY